MGAAGIRSHFERVRPFRDPGVVAFDNQRCADFLAEPVAEFVHLREFVARVHVHQRKREFAGIKGFLRQPNHHARIFADGIEHHRMFRLGDGFADDMN